MVGIYALASVSGANFNPAVSLSLGLIGKLAWADVAQYILVQLVAGLAATIACTNLFGAFPAQPILTNDLMLAVAMGEGIYTFMLCFVVLNVAVADAGNQYYGLAIGFVVVAGGYSAGGFFNPAIALGVDVGSNMTVGSWCWPRIAFQCVGAALAAGLYKIVRPEDSVCGMTQKLVAEFIGTFILVVTVVLGGNAYSIAAALMCMIYALGSVSGANFNPAVSLCLVATGRESVLSARDAGMYVGVQALGGVAAGAVGKLLEKKIVSTSDDFPFVQVAVSEFAYTFLLCFVVASVATVQTDGLGQFFGFSIGSCVTAGGSAIGKVSGGCLNPAVVIGLAVVAGSFNFKLMATKIGFECLGALVAAGVFVITQGGDPSFASGEVKAREIEEPLL